MVAPYARLLRRLNMAVPEDPVKGPTEAVSTARPAVGALMAVELPGRREAKCR